MDGMIFIIIAAYALVQIPEPRQLPQLRFPRFSLIRFRQWRRVCRQLKRDRAFQEAMHRIELDESERIRAIILARTQQEVSHASH